MGDWSIPEGYKFTESDEWVKLEDGEALIGISDYAQDQLSDLVFVELPTVGETFGKGEVFGVVESVKAAADVMTPISGEIVAVNDDLEDTPEVINEDAYGEGWIIRIKPSDTSEMDDLMDAKAYEAYCEERG
jgi:glycine cleavage system H protein